MNTDMPVLITGESGTGKSLIARALHDFSDRRAQPFVLAAGQDLGQGDGAAGPALVSRARGGTLVIDGLGDLDGSAQARLVRLLDTLAEGGPRLLAIAEGDLSAALEAGTFRADLYYRLAGVTLHVPPLRERIEDIPLLAEHFLARAARDTGAARKLAPAAVELLRHYTWPGNVRQLENTMRRLLVTGQASEIGRAELELALSGQPAAMPVQGNNRGEKLGESVSRHLRRYFELHGEELPPPGLYDRILREIEAPLIEIALEYTGGNQARCADLLGINRNTLRKKISDLDIRVTRRRKLM